MVNKKNWLEGFVSDYKGTIIEVLSKNNNGKIREVARRAPGVRAIVVTKDNKFIITREYREYLEKEIDYRLPGGKVVDTLSEYHGLLARNHLASHIRYAVNKELEEETGIRAKSVEKFTVSNSGGTIDWDLHYFEMKDLSFGESRPEDDEKIEVLQLTVKETVDIIVLKQMSEDRSRIILMDYLLQHYPMEVTERIQELNTNDA